MRPEIGHCNTMRFNIASTGDSAVPALLESWETTPSLRNGVVITFGIMLWYVENTGRTLETAGRVIARRHLLRSAVAEESWLRAAFVEAADWTNDPTYLPLIRATESATVTLRKLEEELFRMTSGALVHALSEQWEAMCAEGWVIDEGLRRSAVLALGSARSALAEQDARTARAVLTALGGNLGAARGRGVRAEGHDLMRGGLEAAAARV